MKITAIELEREDIISLFSDITYGTDFSLEMVGNPKKIQEFRENEDVNGIDIYEEIRADWLLDGGSLELTYDDGCDDEPTKGIFDIHMMNEQINKAMCDDELKGFVTDLINEDGDMYVGWNLVQYIAYGEVIFG